MTKSIPASFIVDITPSVLSSGGSGLDLVGLVLTNDTRVPIGEVLPFASAPLVSAFFGPTSPEASYAASYFAAYDGAPLIPAKLLFAQFPVAPVAAYLESGVVATPLATLAALRASTLTLTVNGVSVTSGLINLTTVTSFSDIAARIQAAFALYDAGFTGSIAGNVLTVTAVTNGTIAIGQELAATGLAVDGAGVGPIILSQTSGATGGTGTYTVSIPQTFASATINSGPLTVAYDSNSDSFEVAAGTPGTGGAITAATANPMATALKLTSAAGAVISPGSAAGDPVTAMNAIIATTQNWASFTTVFKPTLAQLEGFATWTNAQKNRFAYVLWDDDIGLTVPGNTTDAKFAIDLATQSGIAYIYAPVNTFKVAALIMGTAAAIDFSALNGRTNFAFTAQSGLTPDVTDLGVATQLKARGVSYYGALSTANQGFDFLFHGFVTGPFAYLDSYFDQIWMNNQFQLSLVTLLTTVRNIPATQVGTAIVAQALSDAIQAAVDFGAIRSGVVLSGSQKTVVNTAAGKPVDATITQRGWYLSIPVPSPAVRAARGPANAVFFYTDGQSLQSINLNSVEVQ